MDSSGLKEDIFYSSSWMQEILEISNIGLWLLEINKNNTDVRLYADDKMLELLGLQKSLSLEDNYKHFAQGVLAEDLEIVQKYIEQMLTTKRLVEVQYRWNHPWWGTIFIRCSGKLYKEDVALVKRLGSQLHCFAAPAQTHTLRDRLWQTTCLPGHQNIPAADIVQLPAPTQNQHDPVYPYSKSCCRAGSAKIFHHCIITAAANDRETHILSVAFK